MSEGNSLGMPRRFGKSEAMAKAVAMDLSEGKRCLLASAGELHEIVGVVPEPSRPLIEQESGDVG